MSEQMSRQQRWQLKQKLLGCCVLCGGLATPDTFLCEGHRDRANNGWARGYKAKREYFRQWRGDKRRNHGAKSYRP